MYKEGEFSSTSRIPENGNFQRNHIPIEEAAFDEAIDAIDYSRATTLGKVFVEQFFEHPDDMRHYRGLIKALAVPLYKKYYFESLGLLTDDELQADIAAIHDQAARALGEGLAKTTDPTAKKEELTGGLAELTIFALFTRQLQKGNDSLFPLPTTASEDRSARDINGKFYGVDFMVVNHAHNALPIQIKNGLYAAEKSYHESIQVIRLAKLVQYKASDITALQYALIDENDDHEFDQTLVDAVTERLYRTITRGFYRHTAKNN